MKLQIRTFGESYMSIGEERITPEAEIVFALLLILAHEAGRPVSRERLAHLLWESGTSARQLQRLRQTLYKAKHLFGVQLVISATAICLEPSDAECDFTPLLQPNWQDYFFTHSPPAGEFLKGYVAEFSRPFAEWVEECRSTIHTRVRIALLKALRDRRSRGVWNAVKELSESCLIFDPHNLEAAKFLAEALSVSGRGSDAVALLDRVMDECGLVKTGGERPSEAASLLGLRTRITEQITADRRNGSAGYSLVGRSESTQLLHNALERTMSGESQSVLVCGEPGVGKTRLVEAFCEGLSTDEVRVLRVACQPSDAQRALSVFADLSSQLLELPGVLGCAPASMEYIVRLLTNAPSSITKLQDPADSEMLFAGIRQAVFDVLDSVSTESKIMIAVEDVHWADEASLSLLGDLFAWCGSRPLHFVMTSRTTLSAPRTFDSAAAEGRLIIHRLAGLGPQSSAELVRAIGRLRGVAVSDEFTQWAVHFAEGNPFFLRELVDHWSKTREEFTVPPTLHSLLTIRIGALGVRELRVLQACAVLKRNGYPELLRQLLELSNSDLIEALDLLGQIGLVAVRTEHVECRHEIIAEVAIRQMSEVTRHTLLRLSAELLEKLSAENASMALLWDCARLWYESGDEKRALSSALACARRLVAIGAPSDAADLLERTISLCSTDEHRLTMLEALSDSLALSTQYGRLAECLRHKQEIKRRMHLRLPRHDSDELMLLDATWRVYGSGSVCLPRLMECLNSHEATSNHRLEAAVLGLIICEMNCDMDMANSIYRKIGRDLEVSSSTNADALFADLIFQTSFGSLDTAVLIAESLLSDLASMPKSMMCRILRNTASTFRRAGLSARAISCLSSALDIAEKNQMPSAIVPAVEGLIQCYLDLDDHVSARQWFDYATANLNRVEDVAMRISLRFLDAEITIAAGGIPSLDLISHESFASLRRSESVRVRMNALAMFVAVSVACRHTVDDDVINDLIKLHLAHRARGGHDFVVSAIYSCLRMRGKQSWGSQLVADYVTKHRRDRSTPSRRLTGVLLSSLTCSISQSYGLERVERTEE